MKITIESTKRVVEIRVRAGDAPPIEGRVWEGHTEDGIPVQCLITRIATPEAANQAQFQKDLQESRPPLMEAVYPLRMVI